MRLLTWNVQWCRGIDGVVDPARIVREARRLAEPDVLCLQEINAGFSDLPGSKGESQVELLRRELAGYQVFFAAAVDLPDAHGTRQRFGNVIASRLPVGRVLRHTLPWPAADAPSMPRAALEVVVEAPFGALRVITTRISSTTRAAIALRRSSVCASCIANVTARPPGASSKAPTGAWPLRRAP